MIESSVVSLRECTSANDDSRWRVYGWTGSQGHRDTVTLRLENFHGTWSTTSTRESVYRRFSSTFPLWSFVAEVRGSRFRFRSWKIRTLSPCEVPGTGYDLPGTGSSVQKSVSSGGWVVVGLRSWGLRSCFRPITPKNNTFKGAKFD